MEFGPLVEPEMVNLDSDVVRAHPDWIVGPAAVSYKDGGRLPLEWRNQHIIDLVNPEAWQYIHDRIDALLSETTSATSSGTRTGTCWSMSTGDAPRCTSRPLPPTGCSMRSRRRTPALKLKAAPPAARVWTWES
jgi:hypothetical protein